MLLLHNVLVLLNLGSHGSGVSLATILLLEYMHLVVLSDGDGSVVLGLKVSVATRLLSVDSVAELCHNHGTFLAFCLGPTLLLELGAGSVRELYLEHFVVNLVGLRIVCHSG